MVKTGLPLQGPGFDPCQGTKMPHKGVNILPDNKKNNSTFIMEIKGNIEKNKQVLSFEAIKNDQLSLKKDQGLMGMKNKIILKDTAQ